MGRPRYENEEDRMRERVVADAVAERLGLTAIKLSPSLYGADFALYAPGQRVAGYIGELRYWAEVKCRKNASNKYGEYMISLGKLQRLRDLDFNTPGVKSTIIVRFTDVCLWCDAMCEYYVGVGRRSDRNDEYDTEPMAFIPMRQFKPIAV